MTAPGRSAAGLRSSRHLSSKTGMCGGFADCVGSTVTFLSYQFFKPERLNLVQRGNRELPSWWKRVASRPIRSPTAAASATGEGVSVGPALADGALAA